MKQVVTKSLPKHDRYIDSSFSESQFSLAYPKGIEYHFWNHARNKIILRKLLSFTEKSDIILDIGCGTGITVAFVRKAGLNCYGCEIAKVQPFSESIAPFFYSNTDVFTLSGDLKEKCKVILLLDVLEHLKSPDEFVYKCTTHFPNLDLLFITLPARKELWSNYDEYYQHLTRYDLNSISNIFQKIDFRLLKAGYFFHTLYIPMRLISLLGKLRNPKIHSPKLLMFHRLFSLFFSMEEVLIPSFIPGSSLYIILKKSGRESDRRE